MPHEKRSQCYESYRDGSECMEWFYNYGKHGYSGAKLDEDYPVKVTDNLRLSKDGKRLAIVNDFASDTLLYRLSDPRAREGEDRKHVFYHVFFGKDAAAARQTINEFITAADLEDCDSVTLLRKEPERSHFNSNRQIFEDWEDCDSVTSFKKESDRLLFYANGHICTSLIDRQEDMKALISEVPNKADDVFILPLKRFMHRCPVCRHSTLMHRWLYMICDECGWEDEDLLESEDEESFGANGCYTIRQYREKYLKFKAEDPSYTWSRQYR